MIKYAIFIKIGPSRDYFNDGLYYQDLAMISIMLEKSFEQQKDKDKEFQQG